MRTKILTFLLTTLALPAIGQEPPADPTPAPPVEPATAGAPEDAAAGDEAVPLFINARALKPKKPPLFFNASASSTFKLTADGWASETKTELKVLQGEADRLRLRLTGTGTVTAVTGEGVASWAVSEQPADGTVLRHLEIRPAEGVRSLSVVIKAEARDLAVPGEIYPLLVTGGDAVGFTGVYSIEADPSVEVRVLNAEGLVPVDAGGAPRRWSFQSFGTGSLQLALTPGGAARAPVELLGLSLAGQIDAGAGSATFTLKGEARVTPEKGGSLAVLSGHAAISELPGGGGYTLRLQDGSYRLVFDRAGSFPVEFSFKAGLVDRSGGKGLDFSVPPGAVVPLTLGGIGEDVRFDPSSQVLPRLVDGNWLGFLPISGHCDPAWNAARDEDEGKLFFASEALVETRVSAGLLRQTTTLTLKPLQGKIGGLAVGVEGEGEILAVEGQNVLAWNVAGGADGRRTLNIEASQPSAGEQQIVVRTQQALDVFPLSTTPVRLTPEGAVRHSGHIRLANEGAVSLEVGTLSGLTQLAPEQWPGGGDAGARQVFVYRFPSGEYSYQIHADQILPEVAVQQILVYEMTETDRVIGGRVELDIREAPLREWPITIPAGFAVIPPTGAEVADYTVAGDADDDGRTLKILFKGPTVGRQLIEFRLEKNIAAAPGEWQLPPLGYPEAKSLRGFVGAATVPGYRATIASTQNLSEVPMAYFPAKVDGLQQAFRLREGEWAATLDVAKLPQSVQADVFHLYSLKEGVAYASVLLNYFVAGAPVSEWSLEVPGEIGNLAVEGQNVQGWTRDDEGGVRVTLHQPALGAATLLLTFEQAMDARGGALEPGSVKPVGVAAERGFIQVVSPTQVRHEITKASPGLLKMEPLELPAEFQVLNNSPSLSVHQYSARPFELSMNVEWFEPGQTIDQLVEFAKLHSEVSRDGQVVTRAEFYVVTRGRGALRVSLPEGSQLWGASVNGTPVNARSDAGQTLLPLPASLDPNTPAKVEIHIGSASKTPKQVRISSPQLEVPTMIATWKVEADRDRVLVPSAASAKLLKEPALADNGFAWLRDNGSFPLFGIVALGLLGATLARCGAFARGVGIVALAAAAVIAGVVAGEAAGNHGTNRSTLEFVAPVVGDGVGVELQLGNRSAAAAMVSPLGVLLAVAGASLLIAALVAPKLRAPAAAAGAALVSFGLLAQRGGAAPFFWALAGAIGIALLVPAVIAAIRDARCPKDGDGDGGPAPKVPEGGAVAALIAGAMLLAPGAPEANASTAPVSPDLISQEVNVEEGRVYGEFEIRVTGEEGDTCLLLKDFAVLTKFEGDGLRLSKREGGYWLVLERDGTLNAKASYEMAAGTGNRFRLPTTKAAVKTVDLIFHQAGWEISSPAAVNVAPLPGTPEDKSGARLTLGLNGYSEDGSAEISLTPKRRDLTSEEAAFYTETADLFIPSPGLVDGRHRVIVRPSRGQIGDLECEVPEGFTVSNVSADALKGWRFDPESRLLRIEISPPASTVFHVLVETQRGEAALPFTSRLMPLKTRGALGSVGTLAVAFGADAQPESLQPDGLTKVNLDDFDASLVPPAQAGAGQASLHAAFRYGEDAGSLEVAVAAVAPEVRANTRQTLSIGDERLVLAVDLSVAITRAGLFNLTFPVPDGLEIETASGAALSHWTESEQDESRIVTLHLKGRTLGNQDFAIQFAGASPGDQESWPVPRFHLREATRQTGQLVAVPEQGIRITPAGRTHVSQLDARAVSGGRPGTLAFRLLQADWQLSLALQTLETWVTASALQEVTLRDGLTHTRIGIDYKVENAAVKTLRLRLPGLTPEAEKTVRATGEAVADLVKLAPDPAEGEAPAPDDLWELRFGRRILGTVHVEIEFQRSADRAADANERVHTADIIGARQAAYWVALRVSGHLDAKLGELPDGWSRVDWGAVPASLQDTQDRSLPAYAFRTVEPDAPLELVVQRHAIAETLRLRVQKGELLTVFSPGGDAVTEALLDVQVVEKSTIEVRLPEGAELLSASVDDETAGIVSVDGGYRFYVVPDEEGGSASVSLSWTHPAGGSDRRVQLAGPSLNVPLQNISWGVVLPTGYELADARGTLDLEEGSHFNEYNFETYRNEVLERRDALANEGQLSLQRGIEWRNRGDQGKALAELGKAVRNRALTASGKEDAQVQVRELQTERAMLGLNTRRQKLFLDNEAGGEVEANEQLKQAAQINPLFFGDTNYNPQEVENLLLGNTVVENDALRRIAGRLVGQQMAAEPAVQGIDVAAEGHGTVHIFHRKVQVDGDAPLELDLRLAGAGESPFGAGLLALIGAAALALVACWRGKRAEHPAG